MVHDEVPDPDLRQPACRGRCGRGSPTPSGPRARGVRRPRRRARRLRRADRRRRRLADPGAGQAGVRPRRPGHRRPTARSPRPRSTWPASTCVDCESIERAVEIAARIPEAAVLAGRGPAGHGPARHGDVTAATSPDVGELLRELAPQVLGALVRRYGDFDTCEDAVQEALLAAAAQWPRRRRAGQPAGLADHRRLPPADRAPGAATPPAGAARRPPPSLAPPDPDPPPADDDTLTLLLLCCHPSLDPGLAGGAHAARRRRPDHGRDRPRVPGPRGDGRPADQPGQAADQGQRRAVRAAAAEPSAPSGSARCCTCCT